MYITTTFYTTDDLVAKTYGDFLLKKYTELVDLTSEYNINYVYYHDSIRADMLQKFYDDIPELTNIDYFNSTQLALLKNLFVLRNICLIFETTEDYDIISAPMYKNMYEHFLNRYNTEYTTRLNGFRKILGIDNSCLTILR